MFKKGSLIIAAALLIPIASYIIADDEVVAPVDDKSAENEMNLEVVYNEINRGFQEIKPIFKKGCYDCHSDRTEFPWYHELPLIGGWMDGHIEEARGHLDISNGFPFKGHGSQAEMLSELWHEIEEDDMPLWSYSLMHWNAEPDSLERDSIEKWVNRSLDILKSYGETVDESDDD